MPGAFTHVTAINLVLTPNVLGSLTEMPSEAKRILIGYLPYAELGALSPDYPYALMNNSDQNTWAELMHYENVDELIRSLVFRVKMLPEEVKERCFAWVAGFLSHLITEFTIRPVIEHHVGSFQENKKEYIACETHQDSYIIQRLGLNHDVFSERLKQKIKCCSDSRDSELLDKAIRNLWSIALTEVYSGYANKCLPAINHWHTSYLANIGVKDNNEQPFCPWFRYHLNGSRFAYPTTDEIDYSYINKLRSENEIVNYDAVFDLAVTNISYYLTKLSLVVFEQQKNPLFANRHLDIGIRQSVMIRA